MKEVLLHGQSSRFHEAVILSVDFVGVRGGDFCDRLKAYSFIKGLSQGGFQFLSM